MENPDLVYMIFIETSADRLWSLLTSPAESPEWFFGNRIEIGDAPGGPYRVMRDGGEAAVDGHILAIEPGRRLRVAWEMPGNPLGEGPPNEIEYLIEPAAEGVVKLSVLEFHRLKVPEEWQRAGREGWSLILSSLKTLLETGRALPRVTPGEPR
jgi:uncharacterized protein YndB with AHSA1/START domain